MKEIEVIIDKNGECSIELFGWEGKGCAEIADKLAKAMGTKTKGTKKAEYYKPEIKEKQKINRGV